MSIELTDITGLKDIEGYPVTVTDTGVFKVSVHGENIESDCYLRLKENILHRLAVMVHKNGQPPIEMMAIDRLTGETSEYCYLGVNAKKGDWKIKYHSGVEHENVSYRNNPNLMMEQVTPELKKHLKKLEEFHRKTEECLVTVKEMLPDDFITFAGYIRGNSISHASAAECRVARKIEAIRKELEKKSDKESTNE